MTVYAEAAERLRALLRFFEENGIQAPYTDLIGNLGELLVMDQLSDCGYEPTLISSHHDYDIKLVDGTRIEVKSGQYDTKNSLWRFDKIQPHKFDILVLVKFEDGFEQEVFYLFDQDETSTLPQRTKTNPDDERRLIRLREDPSRHRRSDMQRLNERIENHRGAWEKLPEYDSLMPSE